MSFPITGTPLYIGYGAYNPKVDSRKLVMSQIVYDFFKTSPPFLYTRKISGSISSGVKIRTPFYEGVNRTRSGNVTTYLSSNITLFMLVNYARGITNSAGIIGSIGSNGTVNVGLPMVLAKLTVSRIYGGSTGLKYLNGDIKLTTTQRLKVFTDDPSGVAVTYYGFGANGLVCTGPLITIAPVIRFTQSEPREKPKSTIYKTLRSSGNVNPPGLLMLSEDTNLAGLKIIWGADPFSSCPFLACPDKSFCVHCQDPNPTNSMDMFVCKAERKCVPIPDACTNTAGRSICTSKQECVGDFCVNEKIVKPCKEDCGLRDCISGKCNDSPPTDKCENLCTATQTCNDSGRCTTKKCDPPCSGSQTCVGTICVNNSVCLPKCGVFEKCVNRKCESSKDWLKSWEFITIVSVFAASILIIFIIYIVRSSKKKKKSEEIPALRNTENGFFIV
jgi:hypothetical protein